MTEKRLPLAELPAKAGDGDFPRSVAKPAASSDRIEHSSRATWQSTMQQPISNLWKRSVSRT